ncbi:alc [Bugula neritina]|uniref:Alc n=1 Tax=Bugula neritina TaxID=10212 RepID=A0A7J7KTZ0_BUGNE|nr:alc [Bugula neritina]
MESTTGRQYNDDDAPEQETYGREIPTRKPTDRHTGPPILPPHLLQVILNKDVSDHLEPGMLPEPNHVMLNHLYALSIKDGVMVLSDTSRYKKKYVTTLLYKPIDS